MTDSSVRRAVFSYSFAAMLTTWVLLLLLLPQPPAALLWCASMSLGVQNGQTPPCVVVRPFCSFFFFFFLPFFFFLLVVTLPEAATA
ncbi:hypothetical protein TRSC58_07655 [Trypanosoma rangeli SC58]|uniref:Uncharacterized protein n=1 Tax=Trypanosoma rangeli SC58 TaxID=429131 RepID=A0A061IUR8_TRYRA|nr:hypothetical protein TRSC58_07655 [Trypanosoma rangeli SC58]